MIFAIAICLTAVIALCRLLFASAIYALPLFVGATAGTATHHSGCGVFGAIAIGGAVAAAALTLGETLFARVRSPLLRLLIATAFAAPAGLADFHAVHDMAAPLIPWAVWRKVFALAAVCIVATVAPLRFQSTPSGDAGQGTGVLVCGNALARPANDP